MTTTIAALSGPQIRYAEFVQLVNPSFTDYFCNAPSTVTINGMTFTGMGVYLGISEIQQDLKSTSVDMSVSISGLTPSSVALILATNLKGSQLTVWRGFLDSDNQILTISGVQQFFQRYKGIVNNISLQETFDNDKRERIVTCSMSSASMRFVLDARIAGIRTNPSSWRAIYPNDTSMDRVPVIASTYFNFGKQPTAGSYSKVLGSTQTNPAALVQFNNNNY
jgi:hypothetical protein